MPPGWEHQPRITLECKAKVLPPGGLLRGEDLERSAADEFVLLHHEKAPELWAEVFHHYRVSSIATATPGSGAMIKAAIGMQIQVAALCKNAEHKAFLEEHLLEWAVRESQRAWSWCFASDADLGTLAAQGGPAAESEESGSGAEEGESEATSGEDQELSAAESGEARAPSRAAAAAAADAAAKLAAKAAAAGMKRMATERGLRRWLRAMAGRNRELRRRRPRRISARKARRPRSRKARAFPPKRQARMQKLAGRTPLAKKSSPASQC